MNCPITWLYAPVWLGRSETPERAVLQPAPNHGRDLWYRRPNGSEVRWPLRRVIVSYPPVEWPPRHAPHVETRDMYMQSSTPPPLDQVALADARAEALTIELDHAETTTGRRPSLTEVWLPGLGAVGALCWRCGAGFKSSASDPFVWRDSKLPLCSRACWDALAARGAPTPRKFA